VPLDSALGRDAKAECTLAFAPAATWVAQGLGHLDLMDHESLLEPLRRWLVAPRR
jgi:hypothetical protein